jgi:hypothetical protein
MSAPMRAKFVALAVITVAVLLYVMFRRIGGVLLPLIIVGLSLLCTVGIMAILKVPIKVPTRIRFSHHTLGWFPKATEIGIATEKFDAFEFSNTPDKEYSRLDGLAGAEYAGISDATITLDIANRHYFDFDKR